MLRVDPASKFIKVSNSLPDQKEHSTAKNEGSK